MSYSSLWVMDKEYKGYELFEFSNSWLFSPVVWGVLSDKYIKELVETPYGYKLSLISDSRLFRPLNNKVNNCNVAPDRICWELSNQQIFFTKDKDVVAKAIVDFVKINSKYDKSSEGIYPLQREHIISRFEEIALEISRLDENEYPYFIWKNTSCDDGVGYWFNKYDEEQDKYIKSSLKDVDKHVTEFVCISNDEIVGFAPNLLYFNK